MAGEGRGRGPAGEWSVVLAPGESALAQAQARSRLGTLLRVRQQQRGLTSRSDGAEVRSVVCAKGRARGTWEIVARAPRRRGCGEVVEDSWVRPWRYYGATHENRNACARSLRRAARTRGARIIVTGRWLPLAPLSRSHPCMAGAVHRGDNVVAARAHWIRARVFDSNEAGGAFPGNPLRCLRATRPRRRTCAGRVARSRAGAPGRHGTPRPQRPASRRARRTERLTSETHT